LGARQYAGLLRGRCVDCVTKRGISMPSVIARRSRVRAGVWVCRMAYRFRDVLAGFSQPSFTHVRPGTISMPSAIARRSRVRGGVWVCRMAYRFRDVLAGFSQPSFTHVRTWTRCVESRIAKTIPVFSYSVVGSTWYSSLTILPNWLYNFGCTSNCQCI